MRQMNAAFLSKLGWRVVVQKHKLWSRILRAKYCNNRCDLDMFAPRADASNAWRGITDSINFVQKGARVEVGNGRNTLFWSHEWAFNKPLASEAMTIIPLELETSTVEEMWDVQHGWKWEKFANLLPENTLSIITLHSLFPGEGNQDHLIWSGSSSGKMTTKSALAIIQEDCVGNEGKKKGNNA
ncbi:hypothetical protein Cgig2_026645 [Carnegiea gigantea]|uniref:Uncharacterized protein n=1 Tax=Carnegiea gigantea TaxID=171969 RepID=A0A9Q1QDA8_9CARY|nr:hypothetical protein Cgig2_026645 [Carnegiea gigantea]